MSHTCHTKCENEVCVKSRADRALALAIELLSFYSKEGKGMRDDEVNRVLLDILETRDGIQ